MIDAGKYFTINKARQYGKTTILTALADYLRIEYEVINLDFQGLSLPGPIEFRHNIRTSVK